MWVEASCISILTSVGGYEDTLICQKGQVAVKIKLRDEEPASWAEAPPNILFLPGRLPLLFIDFVVGVSQLDLTIRKACWDDVQLQVLVILHREIADALGKQLIRVGGDDEREK